MSKNTIKVNMNVYDIPILVEQLKKLEQENKQLKGKINKAIEYIEERFDGEVFTHTFDKCNMRELLEILGDKE